jgi:high-affinity nickel permease
MERQDDMNNLLNARYVPKAPDALAERIIHAAITSLPELIQPRNIWAELGAMFALPHPSVVVATCVLVGLAVGLQAGDGLTILSQDWSSFMDINEGGWL